MGGPQRRVTPATMPVLFELDGRFRRLTTRRTVTEDDAHCARKAVRSLQTFEAENASPPWAVPCTCHSQRAWAVAKGHERAIEIVLTLATIRQPWSSSSSRLPPEQ